MLSLKSRFLICNTHVHALHNTHRLHGKIIQPSIIPYVRPGSSRRYAVCALTVLYFMLKYKYKRGDFLPGFELPARCNSPMDLPTELYRPIIGFVRDRATLLSLLFTSHLVNTEAERSLYYRFEHVQNVQSQVLFLQRVLDCPRVAQYVYSYKFEIDWRTKFGTQHIFWDLLPKALQAFVNLKVLQFRTNGGMPVKGLLDGCTFQLEHCHWRCHSDEAQMQVFLESQTKLKCLSLGGWDEEKFSAPSNYDKQPEFRYLAGCYGVIHAFLPSRNITHVHWVPDMDDPWDIATGLDVAGLALSLQKLKFLKLGGYFPRPHLCAISDHLTNLVFLELMGYDTVRLDLRLTENVH